MSEAPHLFDFAHYHLLVAKHGSQCAVHAFHASVVGQSSASPSEGLCQAVLCCPLFGPRVFKLMPVARFGTRVPAIDRVSLEEGSRVTACDSVWAICSPGLWVRCRLEPFPRIATTHLGSYSANCRQQILPLQLARLFLSSAHSIKQQVCEASLQKSSGSYANA